ncbi:MAG: hypothetical protein FVQ81_02040 [Candidatus Glassbacteria bacterium]|nr:hypothetical protein [Candidatus Glassbacteria bacterium]
MLKMMKLVILLAVFAVAPAIAQFPPGLLPASHEEVGDTSTAIRDSVEVLYQLNAARADSLKNAVDSLQNTLDSLFLLITANADSVAVNQGLIATLMTEMLAAQSAIDSLQAAADTSGGGGGGGGGGAMLDTTWYDIIFGSTKADSSTYGAFSGFRWYAGGIADSSIGDTLIAVAVRGGQAFLLPGDSLFVFDDDSLATADTVQTDWTLTGGDKYRSIIAGDPDDSPLYFRNRFDDAGWTFRNLALVSIDGPQAVGTTMLINTLTSCNLIFDNCYMVGEIFYTYGLNGNGQDSTLVVRNCEMAGASFQIHFVGGDYDDTQVTFENNTGDVNNFLTLGNAQGTIHMINNTWYLSGEGIEGLGTCQYFIRYTGGYYEFGPSTYRPMYKTNVSASGTTFLFDVSATDPHIYMFNERYIFSGCTFINGGIFNSAASQLGVVGCNFFDLRGGAIAINIDVSSAQVVGSHFYGWTTAIDVAGALSNVTVGGNIGNNNTTDINGSPNTVFDNTWY